MKELKKNIFILTMEIPYRTMKNLCEACFGISCVNRQIIGEKQKLYRHRKNAKNKMISRLFFRLYFEILPVST
jgi:hypothetical protein